MADAPVIPESFAALNARHLVLLEAQADERLDAGAARVFVDEAAAAGVQIESVGDRDSVRSMINYWTATLARLPMAAPAAGGPAADHPDALPPKAAPPPVSRDAGPPPASGWGSPPDEPYPAAASASVSLEPAPPPPVGAGTPRLDANPFSRADPGGEPPPTAQAAPAPVDVEPPPARSVLAAFDASQSPELDESANPFVGLASFDAATAANYFGRGDAARDLLQHVLVAPLVVVSGGPGTGKSSLVRAGLANAVAADPQTRDWRVVVFTPGRDPVASLALAIAHPGTASPDWVDQVRKRIDADPAAAAAIVNPGPGLILVVDRMEDFFGLAVPDQQDRAARALAGLIAKPDVHLVLAIGDEYLAAERRSPRLAALHLDAVDPFRMPPLSAEDIRAAITGPAARVGLVFQDGLVERIVADVGSDPAALPLLQYTLLRLWQRREGNRITLAAYREVGGPATALRNAAQQVYDGLGSDQAQQDARTVFQQLVRPSLVYEFERDRATRSELERLVPAARLETVLQPFVAAALIRISRVSAEGSDDRIEIVHDALIRNWDELRQWAGEVREREQAILSLDAQAQRWTLSSQAAGHLLFGRALAQAEQVLDDYRRRPRADPAVEARVTAFLQGGRDAQRRLRSAAVVIALLLIALAAVALYLRHRNDANFARWEGQTDVAAHLSEQNASLATLASTAGSTESARQFIQMLLSRGTIGAGELPPGYADMTAMAATFPAGSWRARFDAELRDGYPAVVPTPRAPGLVQIDLPHARVFYDPVSRLPMLAAMLAQRDPGAAPSIPNALYRWPGLADQPDEIELARRGFALGRLIDGRDLAWGPQAGIAINAGNLLPTMFPVPLTSSGGASLSDWSLVTLWMRFNHNLTASRVLYLAGAIPAAGAAGGTPPARLWLIAASLDDGGRLLTDAAMIPASNRSDKADELPGRTSVAAIAAATGLDLSALLRAADSATTTPASQPAPTPSPTAVAGATSVYIQGVGLTDAQAAAIKAALGASGLRTPAVQRHAPCVSSPQLRYYFESDALEAARAAVTAGAAMRDAGLGDQIVTLRRLDPKRYGSARAERLELWLCGSAAISGGE